MVVNLAFFVIFYSAILTVPYYYRMYAASSYLPKVPDSLFSINIPVNRVRLERNITFEQGDVVKDEIFTSNTLYLYTRDEYQYYNHTYPLDFSKNELEFYVKSKQNAHIMLFKSGNGPYYEIYIQESNNKTLLLRNGKSVWESTPIDLLDPLSYKKFWIEWNPSGYIGIGNPEYGTILGHTNADPFKFDYFTVRTYTSGQHKPDEVIDAYWIFDRAVPAPAYN